jgi:predicted flap endonuclease-1-like 5' DNA nuclease
MAEVGVETLAREEAERKLLVEQKAYSEMATKASDMKQSRLAEEQKTREAIASHKKAQEEEEKIVGQRDNFEKQIEEDEKKRKRAIRIAERESANALNAEERILAEKRALDKARNDVKKKIEARERKEKESRAKEEFEESEKKRVRRELEAEISEELERLKGEENKMTAKEYLLARVEVKGHLIDFRIIGRDKGNKDDLQAIKGLDAGLEERLNLIGISTFDQISKLTDELADELNEAIEHFPGRIRRQGWIQQAKVILEDDLLSDL